MTATFSAPRGLGGEIAPPADKSITHRALLLASVAEGDSLVRNPLQTGDCLSTSRCLRALGVALQPLRGRGPAVRVHGTGLHGLREPATVLDAGNSGTTTRLLAGLLAGLPFLAVLTGDRSLRQRPMLRVVEPLRRMGARIAGREGGRLAPLCFLPGTGELQGVEHLLQVGSAQVKSAMLLAGLRADGPTAVRGLVGSRDHTERLLVHLGVRLEQDPAGIVLHPPRRIRPFELEVPGDLSSAAFFMAAAVIGRRELTVRGCGVNPTRTGFVEVLRRMGAAIRVEDRESRGGEPVGTLRVSPRALRGTEVTPGEVPYLIDEIPLLAVVGAMAEGRTVVSGAGELRHKESDRLAAVELLLEALGGRLESREDGFAVEGPQRLRGGTVDPGGDHRIAMAAAAAAAGLSGAVAVHGFSAAGVSYPDFLRDFRRLGGEVS